MAVGVDDLGPILEALLRVLMERQYGPLGLHGHAGCHWPKWALKVAEERGWQK